MFSFVYGCLIIMNSNLPNSLDPIYGGFQVGKTYIGIYDQKPFETKPDSTIFTVIDRKDGWLKVKYRDGNLDDFHSQSLMTKFQDWQEK